MAVSMVDFIWTTRTPDQRLAWTLKYRITDTNVPMAEARETALDRATWFKQYQLSESELAASLQHLRLENNARMMQPKCTTAALRRQSYLVCIICMRYTASAASAMLLSVLVSCRLRPVSCPCSMLPQAVEDPVRQTILLTSYRLRAIGMSIDLNLYI